MRISMAVVLSSGLLLGCGIGNAGSREIVSAAGKLPGATHEIAPQIGSFGFDTAGMDRSVDPGDDFYAFANGSWHRNTVIPPDKSNVGMFQVLADLSANRTRQILEEKAGSSGTKIGDVYASFMDRERVNALGAAPIAKLLREIDLAGSRAELASLMGRLSRIGVSAPFGKWVYADDANPDAAIFQLFQGGLGMPDRDYYLSTDPSLVTKRNAYRNYLSELLKLVGGRDAEGRAEAVFKLETQIAQNHWSKVDTIDAHKTYNKMSPSQLAATAPEFPWASYISGIGIASEPALLVRQPSAILGSAKLLAGAPLGVLKDYLKLRTIDSYAPYLSDPFVAANFNFRGTVLTGASENQPLWKRGSDLVTNLLGEGVGKEYVRRHFPPAAKAQADEMVRNIISAMDRRLQGLSWMTATTKARARAKLAALTPKIGYPETWRDYSALEVRRDDLVGNVMRGRAFEHQRQIGKLGKPVDRNEWGLYPQTVNAYADNNLNQIVFPAAILQPPFFDPNADPAINYGAIGGIIGHEISHHFDDHGSKFDETGRLKEWWTQEDRERFEEATTKLVSQYGKYEPLPGKFIDGKLTLGENIADLAGLAVAYDAYRASLRGREPPVLDGFTADQRFFLGLAQAGRRKHREADLIRRLINDTHSPSDQRVKVVRNLDPWYDAFRVEPEDRLYLSPEQRVRIW